MKTLSDWVPTEFFSEFMATPAAKFLDVVIAEEHSKFEDTYLRWPGSQKNVHCWVKLDNGYVVGWNENPSRGWSFPTFRPK